MTRLAEPSFPAESLISPPLSPPCPFFEDCGACQFQHVAPDAYQTWKETSVRDVMDHNGIVPDVWLPPVWIGAGTRRRVAISALRDGEQGLVLGFHRYHEHTIAPVDSCLLLTPVLDKIYKKLPDVLPPLLPKGVQVDILLQEADGGAVDCVISGLAEREDAKLGAKQTSLVAALAEACDIRRVSFKETDHSQPVTQIALDKMTKTSGALKVEISAGAFLQPSAEGENALSAAVMAALGKMSKKDAVLDLFSGCGTFAGRVLEKCAVHAVEGDFGMANSLKNAAKGHTRFTAEARDLFKEPMSVREMRSYKAVIFDPPRAGAKEQCQKLAKSDVPLVIGVSCNPATFARDAKLLRDGGYRLQSLQIFDQFLYTSHVEMVGVFSK